MLIKYVHVYTHNIVYSKSSTIVILHFVNNKGWWEVISFFSSDYVLLHDTKVQGIRSDKSTWNLQLNLSNPNLCNPFKDNWYRHK